MEIIHDSIALEAPVKQNLCGSTVLPDGKVVMVFDPATKTPEEFGDFEGSYTFECCAALPDGKVVMVPCNYPAIVLFDPATKTLEEVGHLEGSYKSECCAALPDGKVVMVPCIYVHEHILRCIHEPPMRWR